MNIEHISDDDDRFQSLLVPVVNATGGVIVSDNGDITKIAFVRLDASARPDVADLARVIDTEGIGQPDTNPAPRYSIPPNPGLLEHLTLADPVSCEFTFFVPWKGNEDFFQAATESGIIALTFKEMARTNESLFLRINGPELARNVQMWREAEQ